MTNQRHLSQGEGSSTHSTIQNSDKIKPKEMKKSSQTKFTDFLRKAVCLEEKEHREEHVNKEIEQFNATVEHIKTKLNNNYLDYIPEALRRDFIRTTESIIIDFKLFSDQAAGSNEEGDKVPGFKEKGEAIIKELNKRMNEMCEDLDRWHQAHKGQEKLKDAMKYIPEEYRSLARTVADREADAVSKAYGQVLRDYHLGIDQPYLKDLYHKLYAGRFRSACDWLQERPNELKKAYQEQIEKYKDKLKQDYEEFKSSMCTDLGKIKQPKEHALLIELGNQYREAWKRYQQDCIKWEADRTLRPDQLQKQFDKYIKLFDEIGENFQDKLPLKEIRNLRTEWVKHTIDHDYIVAIIGIDSMDTELFNKARMYKIKVNLLSDKINTLFKTIKEAGAVEAEAAKVKVTQHIDEFVSEKRKFEEYLSAQKLLE